MLDENHIVKLAGLEGHLVWVRTQPSNLQSWTKFHVTVMQNRQLSMIWPLLPNAVPYFESLFNTWAPFPIHFNVEGQKKWRGCVFNIVWGVGRRGGPRVHWISCESLFCACLRSHKSPIVSRFLSTACIIFRNSCSFAVRYIDHPTGVMEVSDSIPNWNFKIFSVFPSTVA